MDDRKLIEEIKIRRPLWDVGDSNYQNREISRSLWDEVSRIMNKTRYEVQKKWKNMRDVYRRELRKHINSTCTSETKNTKWRLFEDLKFLENIVQFYETPRCVIKSVTENGNITNGQKKDILLQKKRPRRKARTGIVRITKTRKKTKLRCSAFVETEMVDDKDSGKQTKDKLPQQNSDDDYNFLLSFYPYMARMPEMKKLYFRVKMQELLYNTMSEVQFCPQSIPMDDSYVITDPTDPSSSSVSLDISANETVLPSINFGQYQHLI